MSRQAKIIVGAVIGVVLVSVGVAAFMMGRQSPSTTESSSTGETVRIEVRGMPQMDVKKDGRPLGKTPVSFIVKKSTQPFELETQWVEQRIYRSGQRMVPRQARKTIVPDHQQTIDFTRKDAVPVPESDVTE